MVEGMGHDLDNVWVDRLGALLLNLCCDRVAALCHLERRRLSRAGVRAGKLTVIHNPVDWEAVLAMARLDDLSDRPAVLSRYGLNSTRRHLICAASFQPRKRQDLLLRAFACVSNDFGDWDLVFCGTGSTLAEGQDLSRRLGLESRTHFLGALSNQNTMELAARTDAVAHLSCIDTFGYSMVEPLLLAKPALVTRVGIGYELEQADVATVIEPDNLEAAVTGLRKILQSDPQVLDRVRRAPAFVRERFDVNKIAQALLDLR